MYAFNTTLSLFNGIAALSLAQWNTQLISQRRYYSEIDKYANQVAAARFPSDIPLGDVTRWREWDIDWASVDFIGAGFPCQSWSVAGTQLGDKDARGMLFWTTLDIIAHAKKHNPTVQFVMENVKMKHEFEAYITRHTEDALGFVYKTLINSAAVSAQHRERYYWTNFEVSPVPPYSVRLSDIVDTCVTSKLTDGEMQYMLRCRDGEKTRLQSRTKNVAQDEKSFTLTANMYKGVPYGVIFDGNNFRKLTATECARLQTFPDGWCEQVVSNTQSLKAYGNAWTVRVIEHILRCAVHSRGT